MGAGFVKSAKTHATPSAPTTNTKYRGLNSIAIASFHPNTTNTAYIHTGICATLDTVLRFASTKKASASRRNLVVMSAALVGERTCNVEGKSNSSSPDNEDAGSDGKVKLISESLGVIKAYRGISSRVYIISY